MKKANNLDRRGWVLDNLEWLVAEIAYYRDFRRFYQQPGLCLWCWGELEKGIVIYEDSE